MTPSTRPPRVAVLVPCHNEERTIGSVVADFRRALPDALVVVADNRSDDATAERAREAGAHVITEMRPGKGIAVRRLLADVEADCYIIVDGDATYEAAAAPGMVALVLSGDVDMVVGERITPDHELEAYRRGHRFGNAVLTWIFQRLFALPLRDTLSGYRVLSRRFVKSFPTGATGFEIEAELNAHAAIIGVPVAEISTSYISRPEGSESKLNTYRDGIRILRRNLRLFRDARPGPSFAVLAVPWLIAAMILVWPPVHDYLDTGLVLHFPSLIAAVGCFLVALNLATAGMILERTTRNRNEALRLVYLATPARTPWNADYSAGSTGDQPTAAR